MTPRCEVIGDCTMWLGDARDVFPRVGPVDVLITDPPYGVDFHGKSTKAYRAAAQTYADTSEHFQTAILPIIVDALASVPRAAIFCGTRHLHAYPVPSDIGGIVCPNGAGRSPWGFGCYHPVLFYGTSPYMVAGLGGRPTATSMSHPGLHVTGESAIGHPCPKPVAFMRWVVSIASCAGHTVLDLFCGSGTTAIVCIEAGRRFVGCEIDEHYWAIACRRIEAAYRQPDLFVPSAVVAPTQTVLFPPRAYPQRRHVAAKTG